MASFTYQYEMSARFPNGDVRNDQGEGMFFFDDEDYSDLGILTARATEGCVNHFWKSEVEDVDNQEFVEFTVTIKGFEYDWNARKP